MFLGESVATVTLPSTSQGSVSTVRLNKIDYIVCMYVFGEGYKRTLRNILGSTLRF